MAHPMTASDAQYAAECDMRTLIEAEKVKNDKKRYAAAMKLLKEHYKAVEDAYESETGGNMMMKSSKAKPKSESKEYR